MEFNKPTFAITGSSPRRAGFLGLALLSITALVLPAWPQAPESRAGREAKKRGRFGSSLNNLKWDDRKGVATERRKRERTEKSKAAPDPTAGDAIRLETIYVVIDIAVRDPASSRFVTGLEKNNLLVFEDGRPQEIATLTSGDDPDAPRSVVLVLDASGSQLPYIEASLDAAASLVAQLAPADQMAIVSDNIDLVIDFTSDRRRLLDAIESFRKRTGRPGYRRRSLQFSAFFAAIRELIDPEIRRPIVIFQTDGDEAISFRDQAGNEAWRTAYDRVYGRARQYGLADIFSAAERSRVTVYTVIPSDPLIGIPPEQATERARSVLAKIDRAGKTGSDPQAKIPEAQAQLYAGALVRGQQAAARVAELTGGWTVFLEDPGRTAEIYNQILTDIKGRYVIGYYTDNIARDGGLRRVRIEVKGRPGLTIEGRNSYYAPSE